MKDINDVLPKVPNMKWGALMNKAPTNDKVEELNKIFPANGKWHTVLKKRITHTLMVILFGKKTKKIGRKLIFYNQSYIH